MKCLRTFLALALLTGAVACGGDDEHEEHEFETYLCGDATAGAARHRCAGLAPGCGNARLR